ncbi:hypothetical protein BCR32DRAFT_330850 [Anaeromyces robustus]|uniref:NlpC/P60 domain-containing protein n=1 Tax=Anaeromyces robustus TaxID=1754192 RepID=A0A1Y1VQC4_9FUNG|nr:hypothetical protein BCR32DRAFT_330850 [Anaeromyces robustus]|eukprot:ORX63502.1 hypothetical protein BCR32DRAFT_330850 [Anaeromyces robustus]
MNCFQLLLLTILAIVKVAFAYTGTDIVNRAKTYLGVPYVLNQSSYSGIDCSGLTQQAYAYYGIQIPRVADAQSRQGTAVNGIANAQPGDLIFYCYSNGYAYHVTMYIGNGQVIHAPQENEYVRIQPYWTEDMCRIRRYIGTNGGGSGGNTGNVGKKIWLPEVRKFDPNDDEEGYAGIMNRPVTGLRVSGNREYRVHLLNSNQWLDPVTGNDENNARNGYAGTTKGDVIDAIAISGNVRYAVHIMNGGWLPPVNGKNYDITDEDYGFAGIIGQAIDAVMIEGRTYATSYNK